MVPRDPIKQRRQILTFDTPELAEATAEPKSAQVAAQQYLTLRKDGRYQIKRKGRTYYLGTDPQQALEIYLKGRDCIERGEDIADLMETGGAGFSIRAVFEGFLAKKHRDADSGAIQWKTYADYKDALDLFDEVINVNRAVSTLRPEHFMKVRKHITSKYGADRTDLYIQGIKSAFAWGARQGYIEIPPYGDEFKKTSSSERQQKRNEKSALHGDRLFTPEELEVIIPRLPQDIEAQFLLCLNLGFYEIDVARLELRHIDWNDGSIDLLRWKRKTKRRGVCWPETLSAIRRYLARRPRPASPEHDGLVFLTRRGFPLAHESLTVSGDGEFEKTRQVRSLGQRFARFLDKLERDGLLRRREGLNLGALRHTFDTEAANTMDREARRLCLGQTFEGIDQFYVKKVCMPRLILLAMHTRAAFEIAEHYGHEPQQCTCVGCLSMRSVTPLTAVPATKQGPPKRV